jgi:hypothetical protein
VRIRVSLIDEISKFSGRASSERRRELLRNVTDLFLGNEAYSSETLAKLEEILLTVADFVATEARAEMAERVADRADTPARLVEHLANDHPSVATPILQRSSVLTDEKLAAIAARSSQDHLAAIAGRRMISELITDLLVSRGDQKVVRKVAGNQGARLSTAGFEGLVKLAGSDTELQAQLVARQDLPPDTVDNLLPHLSEALMVRLADAGYSAEGRLPTHILHKVQERLAGAGDDKDRAAKRLARLIESVRSGKLALPGLIEELATQDKAEDLATVLATFANVDAGYATAALANPDCSPIVMIARALDINWACFLTIVTLRARRFHTTDTSDPALKKRYINLAARDAQRSLEAGAAKSVAKPAAA